MTKKKKFTLKQKKLTATLTFDKKKAKKMMDTRYYEAQGKNLKHYSYLEQEKGRLATKRLESVSKILDFYRQLGLDGEYKSVTGKILKGIYSKHLHYAKNPYFTKKTQKILQIISRPETLILAYKRLKGNKGAMSAGAPVDKHTFDNYTPSQKRIYYVKNIFPDGFSLRDVYNAGFLILKGDYPWGSSRRIWLTKPGNKTKKRPITIPPFMDRIVQEAIKMVLVAIWEPYFEKMNRSFGFRPNKSSHDAIVAMTSIRTQGLFRAIEGDIEAAYDNVQKDILLEQLSRKIDDIRFMRFMKKRLKYDYVDGKTRVSPELGIPQGGIDSPYLFNIYLYDLDCFVMDDLQQYLKKLNEKKNIKEFQDGKIFLPRKNLSYKVLNLTKKLRDLKNITKDHTKEKNIDESKKKLYSLIRSIRLRRHMMRRMPSFDPNRRKLRLFYARYADDWILLSNCDNQIAEVLKKKIANLLQKKLRATLSEKKTIITDIRIEPAHFLGFELKRTNRSRLVYLRKGSRIILSYSGGLPVNTSPDRTRLINRMHMKGYCDKKGFPRELPWLSGLDTHIIIERYNSVLRGMCQYYVEWIKEPSRLNRWIYILRYSCLKTLAKKYNITIRKVFKKFGVFLNNASRKTIECKVVQSHQGESFSKTWRLLTYNELLSIHLRQNKKEKLLKIFWSRENGTIGEYELSKNGTPTVTHENFLDSITWTSLRTQSSFDMPCAVCGNVDDIEMHHINHIRKTPYKALPKFQYKQILQLRNRKQIPVCKSCHLSAIHSGEYSGKKLTQLIDYDERLIDNRVLHVESYVHKGKEHFGKKLEEKRKFFT
jgi:retron-type reverse transcriptase